MEELDEFATTVIDGVFLLLASLFESTAQETIKVDALMRYFRGPGGLQVDIHYSDSFANECHFRDISVSSKTCRNESHIGSLG